MNFGVYKGLYYIPKIYINLYKTSIPSKENSIIVVGNSQVQTFFGVGIYRILPLAERRQGSFRVVDQR